jgi:tetratricopeptide (TPR) repeat protein
VHSAHAGAGDIVHFKSLDPGIYFFCAWMSAGAPVCRTFDLNVNPQKLHSEFFRIFPLKAKMKSYSDLLQVSSVRLKTPDKAVEELQKASAARGRGDPEEGLEHLLRAVEIYPNYVDALNNLGTYYFDNKEYRKASGYLERATKLDKGFYAAWANYASCLFLEGRLEDSVKAGLKALKLRPDSVVANSIVGRAYYHLHKYKEAKKYLLKHLELDPESTNPSQLVLYQIAVAEKKWQDADAYLKGYFECHPYMPVSPSLKNIHKWILSKIRM